MIDGTEYGPRFCEIGNWVGKAVYSPRVTISKVLARNESDNPGIYFLKGTPNSDSFSERIYIGEAENIRSRIKQHLNDSKKDFDELIFFTSKDELLTKTQIRYLEARIVQLALEAKAAEIDNGNSPSLPTLHEADISDMEYFLEQIKLILPIMGFKFLISTTLENSNQTVESQESDTTKQVFNIKTKSLNAKMFLTEKGFIVEKGSEAKRTMAKSMTTTYKNLYNKLVDTELLVENKGVYIFSKDTIFSSPSAASSVVLARNSNGFIEWVNEEGKSYKDLQDSII